MQSALNSLQMSAVCCLQALSALLWRPHSGHSLKPTWNKVHINWGKATMAVGATAVCLGIYVSGVGWPWYLMFAFSTGSILGAAYYIDPLSSKKVWPHCIPVVKCLIIVCCSWHHVCFPSPLLGAMCVTYGLWLWQWYSVSLEACLNAGFLYDLL